MPFGKRRSQIPSCKRRLQNPVGPTSLTEVAGTLKDAHKCQSAYRSLPEVSTPINASQVSIGLGLSQKSIGLLITHNCPAIYIVISQKSMGLASQISIGICLSQKSIRLLWLTIDHRPKPKPIWNWFFSFRWVLLTAAHCLMRKDGTGRKLLPIKPIFNTQIVKHGLFCS